MTSRWINTRCDFTVAVVAIEPRRPGDDNPLIWFVHPGKPERFKLLKTGFLAQHTPQDSSSHDITTEPA